MAYRCEMCDKKTAAGRQHTHRPGVAGGQWKKRAQTTLRRFKPNLHLVTLPVAGVTTTMKLCSKCIKRIRFDNKKTASLIDAATTK